MVSALWMNFAGTIALADVPFAIGVWDILCASCLVMFGDRRALVVAGLFVVMVVLYPLEQRVGRSTLYTIIDLIAYAQVAAIGGGGFGELLRNVRSALFGLRGASPAHSMGGGRNSERGAGDSLAINKERGASE